MSSFNGSGTFIISGVGLPYVSGNVISSAVGNQLNTDLATGLSTCLLKDGTQVVTANIPFNNFNINNISAVGVGTAIPSSKVHVYANAASDADLYVQNIDTTSGSQASLYLDAGAVNVDLFASVTGGAGRLQTSTNHPFTFGTNATERIRISVNGGFSVGTVADPGSGSIYATGNVTAYYSSDRRLKTNISVIENALDKLSKINGVTFDWTDEHISKSGGEDSYFMRKHDVGVIAQEVQEVLPEVVAEREDGTLAVKYDRIIPLLIEAIKEQGKKIAELESKLKA